MTTNTSTCEYSNLRLSPRNLDLSPVQTLILSFAVILLVRYAYSRALVEKVPRKVFVWHPWLPSFINGTYAAYKLGTDETTFLLSLQERYGDAVYMPFPLNQHFILDDKIVRKIYSGAYNKELSFIPIRKQLSTTIFGMHSSITSLDSDQLDKHIFPVHSRGMAKPKLAKAVHRFQQSIDDTVKKECASWSGERTVDLVDWTYTLMFKASMAALFGDKLDIPLKTSMKCFKDFDTAFPLLASEKIPEFAQRIFPAVVAQGVKSRDYLNTRFGQWARETSCAGLEAGDVVKEMAEEGLRLGFSDYDNGSGILGDFWALLANNPFAVSWILIYLLQADDSLLQEVMAEIDGVDTSMTPAAQAEMPLLTSVIFETLRLQSSSFSIRQASVGNKGPVHVVAEQNDQPTKSVDSGTWLLPREKLICITRVGHLDPAVWGPTARMWNGRRFYDNPETQLGDLSNAKARRIPEVRAFGGGVSICEGRNLAVAELKTFLVPVLQAFQFRLTPATLAKSEAVKPLDRLPCISGTQVHAPKPTPGRPGLGVLQLDGVVYAVMSRR